MRRQIAIGVLPVIVLGFVVAYLRMVAGERRVKKSGGSPTRPHVWRWAFAVGIAAMLVGALVAWLDGLVNHTTDQVHSAMTGTFMLAPGLLVGLGIGAGRWLGSRTVWRGRSKGVH